MSADLATQIMSTLPSAAQQRSQQLAAGISPRLIVSSTSDFGRAVHYHDKTPLPIGSLVALYRCLLVRTSRYESWLADGTVQPGVDDFWRNYTITLRFDDKPEREWLCLPVGDSSSSSSSSSSTWWSIGKLSKQSLALALAALNQRTLGEQHARTCTRASATHTRARPQRMR